MRCILCGEEVEMIHMHHVVPRAAGGSSEATNLAPLCTKCHHKMHHSTRSTRLRLKKRLAESVLPVDE